MKITEIAQTEGEQNDKCCDWNPAVTDLQVSAEFEEGLVSQGVLLRPAAEFSFTAGHRAFQDQTGTSVERQYRAVTQQWINRTAEG